MGNATPYARQTCLNCRGAKEETERSTFRASIHTAYRDRKIKENPNGFLERIETIPTDKEHLSQDEVIRLASTPCSAPALKRAFLFSCLTALRKSDIKKLTWEEIQSYGNDGGMLSLIKTTFFLYFSLAYALSALTDLFVVITISYRCAI